MLKSYYAQLNGVYSNCLSMYKESANYVNANKENIDPMLITMTVRRKLCKECLRLLACMYRIENLDLTRFLKLRKIHINQLRRLGDRSLKKNRLFYSQMESLFRRTCRYV